jgi:Tfp pilus assembly protein PilF
MRNWPLLLAALLAACATAPLPPEVRDGRFFHDAAFRPASERIRAEDVFALSPEMKGYLAEEIERQARVRGRQLALVDSLYTRGQLKLDYDSERTRNAAQAFAARSGNCLSLVIMTAAFAKELDLPVTYQKVYVDDEWARSGDIYLAIGHVNLTLGRRKTDEGGFGYRVGRKPLESEGMTIDFLPPADMRAMRSRAIGEEIVVAMYMNNRAVEALARGQVDDAYWWAREAVVQAPEYLVPLNTLGAIYRQHGNVQEASVVLRYVLEREPDNIQAMSNMIAVLGDLGRTDEAQRLAAKLRQMDPDPAFSHFQRGMAAMREGDMKTAKEELAREVKRAPDYHEFQFWLAVAYFNLGELDAARRHMEIAMKNSTTRRDQDLYAAKLDKLNSLH